MFCYCVLFDCLFDGGWLIGGFVVCLSIVGCWLLIVLLFEIVFSWYVCRQDIPVCGMLVVGL